MEGREKSPFRMTPGEYEKNVARIKRLRLLDDIFMRVVLKDNIEGVQDIVRILLERDDIVVTEVRTQDDWPNLVGHSVILDVTARDSAGRWFNIEIQRASEGAGAKRARYHAGALDWHILPAGREYGSLPEVYVIMITETDVLEGGFPIYHIRRVVEETGRPFPDGAQILYVNGSYVGGDAVGRLMEDFRAVDPETMHHRSLADRAQYYKTTEGGLNSRCQIMEEVRAEGRAEGRAEMIRSLLLGSSEKDLLYDGRFKALHITPQEIEKAKTAKA